MSLKYFSIRRLSLKFTIFLIFSLPTQYSITSLLFRQNKRKVNKGAENLNQHGNYLSSLKYADGIILTLKNNKESTLFSFLIPSWMKIVTFIHNPSLISTVTSELSVKTYQLKLISALFQLSTE